MPNSNKKSDIFHNLQELYESGKKSSEDIKNLIHYVVSKATNHYEKNIESINNITKEILTISITMMHEKKDITKDNIQAILEGLITGLSCSKEQLIKQVEYELLITKYYLEEQKEEYSTIINEAFSSIDSTANNFTDETKNILQQVITEIKLKNIETLGIMEETLKQSIQLAINEGINVEQHVKEITKTTFENALKTERFSKQRIAILAEKILTIIINTAEIMGKDIQLVTSGTIDGLKEGISNDIERFKATIDSSYGKLSFDIKEDSKQIIDDLKSIDNTFISILNQLSHKVEDTAWQILMINIKAIEYNSSKFQNIANETAELLMKYMHNQGNEFSKNTKQFTKIAVSNTQSEITHLAYALFKITSRTFSSILDGAKKAINEEKEK